MQILREGWKRPNRFHISIGRHGNKNLRRSDINTSGVRPHHRQTPVHFSIRPFLLCHVSPPLFVRQRARHASWIVSQTGSSQHQTQSRVTIVIAHRPGIKLLDGLAFASTIGVATYPYHYRAHFLTLPLSQIGVICSFLLLIWRSTVGDTPWKGGE